MGFLELDVIEDHDLSSAKLRTARSRFASVVLPIVGSSINPAR